MRIIFHILGIAWIVVVIMAFFSNNNELMREAMALSLLHGIYAETVCKKEK